LTEKLKNKAIIILGAGHFGQRAAALLSSAPHTSLWIVDRDVTKLKKIGSIGAKRIAQDGVRFLTKHFSHLAPSTFIIPAVPVHLAFEWLRAYINEKGTVEQIPVPKVLPFAFLTIGREGGVFAGQLCRFPLPDDCPEPANRCTVTGKKRGTPLYRLLAEVQPRGLACT